MEEDGGIEYDKNGPMFRTRPHLRVGVRRTGHAQIIHLVTQDG